MDPIELAWAAGFYDGEGTTVVCGDRIRVGATQATSDGGPPSVLLRFQAAVGIGVVRGPYFPPGNRRPQWQWYAYGDNAHAAIGRLWPFLTDVKRNQYLGVCERIA